MHSGHPRSSAGSNQRATTTGKASKFDREPRGLPTPLFDRGVTRGHRMHSSKPRTAICLIKATSATTSRSLSLAQLKRGRHIYKNSHASVIAIPFFRFFLPLTVTAANLEFTEVDVVLTLIDTKSTLVTSERSISFGCCLVFRLYNLARPTYTRVMSITASLSSMNLPSAPPPHRMSLYACIPLPPQVSHGGHITLHPKLQRNDARKLNFDLLDPGRCDAQLRQWGNACYEPATNPPLPSLVLLIQGFPWPIVVHASSVRWGVAAVTVLDVITELSRALQLPAAEYIVQDGLMGSMHGADPQSSKAAPEIRRLEYLRGKSRLVGLSQSNWDVEAWMVHIE